MREVQFNINVWYRPDGVWSAAARVNGFVGCGEGETMERAVDRLIAYLRGGGALS